LDFDHTLTERALGVQWHVTPDTFGFKIATKDKPLTIRGILSVISSIYNPLGFVALFHLSAKTLLQNICRKQLGWDDFIPEEDLLYWKLITSKASDHSKNGTVCRRTLYKAGQNDTPRDRTPYQ